MSPLCYFVFLVALHTSITFGIRIDNFDALIKDFGDRQSPSGNSVAWFDAYMTNKNLLARHDLSYCKITVTTNNMTYGHPQNQIIRPSVFDTTSFRNNLTNVLSEKYKRKVQVETSFTWSASTKLNIGASVSVSTGIPEILDVNVQFGADFDLKTGMQQRQTKVETQEKDLLIQVASGKGLTAEILNTEQDIEVPWVADVVITGYVAISYQHQINGAWLHCYPVNELSNNVFQYSSVQGGLLYKAKGRLESSRGTTTVVNISEHDL